MICFLFGPLYFSKFFFVPLSCLLLGDYFFSYFILMYWWLSGFISMCNYSLVVFKFFPYLWFLALITMCLLNLTCLDFPDFSNLKIYDIHQIFGHFFSPRCLFWPILSPLFWDSSSTYVRPFKVVSQVLISFFPELLCCSNLISLPLSFGSISPFLVQVSYKLPLHGVQVLPQLQASWIH